LPLDQSVELVYDPPDDDHIQLELGVEAAIAGIASRADKVSLYPCPLLCDILGDCDDLLEFDSIRPSAEMNHRAGCHLLQSPIAI
jgi:hypothetical protein